MENKPDATRGGSPQAWEVYFMNSARDIARDFYTLGMTEYEDIAAFISSSKAMTKPNAREIYNLVQKYATGEIT